MTKKSHISSERRLMLAAAAVSLILSVSGPARARKQNDKTSAQSSNNSGNVSGSFNLGKDATAKDVGLPIYPGARRHKDTSDDSSALNMGLWGGSTGFKMAVLKMETPDSPDKVTAFYRKALAKYGKVLTCVGGSDTSNANTTPAPAADANNSQDKSSQALDCGTEKSDKTGIELKSGTKDKQHIVGITPEGSVTTFQLVYIETRGLDNDTK